MEEESKLLERIREMVPSIDELEACVKLIHDTRINNVIEALNNNEWKIINNHNPEAPTEKIDGVVEFVGKDMNPAQLYAGANQCFNKLYVGNDEKPHVSTMSIAGNIACPAQVGEFSEAMDRVVEDYNKTIMINRMKIKKIYWADGTVSTYIQ